MAYTPLDAYQRATAPGTWYYQLQSILTAWQTGAPIAEMSSTFENDKGKPELLILDQQQQQVSMEQAQGLLNSLSDTQVWAIQDHAVQNAIEYINTNMTNQLSLAMEYYTNN